MRAFVVVVVSLVAACRAPANPGSGDDSVDAPVAPDAAPNIYCNATDPRSPAAEIVATPEAGEQPYIDALMPAQSSIDVMIYEMGYGAILDTLKAKATAGIPVRVLFDQS